MGIFTRRAEPIAPEKAKASARSLGLSLDGLTVEAVKAEFRKIIRETHPDVGGNPAEAAALIAAAGNARNVLITWIEALPADECSCKGTGFVRTGGAFGSVKPCPHCPA